MLSRHPSIIKNVSSKAVPGLLNEKNDMNMKIWIGFFLIESSN